MAGFTPNSIIPSLERSASQTQAQQTNGVTLGGMTAVPQMAQPSHSRASASPAPPTPQPNNRAANNTGGPTSSQRAAAQAAAAQAAAQAAQNAKIDSVINAGYSSAQAGGAGSADLYGNQLTSQGNQYLTNAQTGQNSIDEARKSIGLNQINSIKDLMNTIKQGLQGTGVALGNTNALDSSASHAAARAYSNYGNTETNKINNSAADANQQQDVNQTNLNLTNANALDTLQKFRDNSVDMIKQNAIAALNSISNTVAFLGGDPNKVNVGQIRDQIVQRAQDQLAAVDSHISSLLQGVHPLSADQTAQNAYSASNAGATPSGPNLPFQLDQSALTTTPANLGGGDQSLIPLALKPKTS